MINRMAQIKEKGFNMVTPTDNQTLDEIKGFVPVDFSRIRIGSKSVSDVIWKLGDLQKINPILANKAAVLKAIHSNDLEKMRNISNYFYKISGIYQRLCRYMAYMYRYDWLVTPYYSDSMKPNKLLEEFNKALLYLDKFEVKKFFGEVALKVIRNGCYYGYLIARDGTVVVQELPIKYCRSRFLTNGCQPVV